MTRWLEEKDKIVSVIGWEKKPELKWNPCSAQPGVIRGSVHITILEFYRIQLRGSLLRSWSSTWTNNIVTCSHKTVATFAWNVMSTFVLIKTNRNAPFSLASTARAVWRRVLFFLCSSFYSLDQTTSVGGSYFPSSNKQTAMVMWTENVARALSKIWKQEVCDWLTRKAQCYLGDEEGPLSVSSSEGVAHPGADCTLNAKRKLPSHHLTRRRRGTEH